MATHSVVVGATLAVTRAALDASLLASHGVRHVTGSAGELSPFLRMGNTTPLEFSREEMRPHATTALTPALAARRGLLVTMALDGRPTTPEARAAAAWAWEHGGGDSLDEPASGGGFLAPQLPRGATSAVVAAAVGMLGDPPDPVTPEWLRELVGGLSSVAYARLAVLVDAEPLPSPPAAVSTGAAADDEAQPKRSARVASASAATGTAGGSSAAEHAEATAPARAALANLLYLSLVPEATPALSPGPVLMVPTAQPLRGWGERMAHLEQERWVSQAAAMLNAQQTHFPKLRKAMVNAGELPSVALEWNDLGEIDPDFVVSATRAFQAILAFTGLCQH